MFGFIFNIVSWIYRYPLVSKIIKRSIMGHEHDKTIDYYRNIPIITPIDELFKIFYMSGPSIEHVLLCSTETYTDGLKYVNSFYKSTPLDRKILSCYEDDGSEVRDIKDKMLKYFGPLNDFYCGTEFEIKVSDISEHKIIVVMDNLDVYSFKDEDLISTERKCDFNMRNLK